MKVSAAMLALAALALLTGNVLLFISLVANAGLTYAVTTNSNRKAISQ